MSLKMYLIESNYGVLQYNNIDFTKLLVVAENKETAINLASEYIDWEENDVIYKNKWNYPLYDYETLYNLYYHPYQKQKVHNVELFKEDEEQLMAKWNNLFNNGFYTVIDEPKITETNEGFLLKASVIPVDVFNKLLAISNESGEKTAMLFEGETLCKLKIKKLRHKIYPLNLKNENSLCHQESLPSKYYENEFYAKKEVDN